MTKLTEGKARESTFLTSFQVMPTHFEEHYEKCTQIATAAGFPGGSVVKNLPASEGDEGSIPGSGRSPGGENGNPLPYSCLGNPMGRGAWQATVHGVAKSQTRLSD